MGTSFFAYPGQPADLAQTIRTAIKVVNDNVTSYVLEGWEQNDISGLAVTQPIFSKIAKADYLAADVTFLNENVAFEIGFAIGCKKRVLLFVNTTVEGDRELANRVGIFDTLGYEKYENHVQLAALISERTSFAPIEFDQSINNKQPVYIVEPLKKNEAHLLLVSRTKKARWRFRTFNPDEDVRLAAMDAVRGVSQSAGVITPLQSKTVIASREHNIRAMFVAGLALGMEIPTLIIHPLDYTPPLDVRDRTKKFRDENDIQTAIHELSLEITEYVQKAPEFHVSAGTILTRLSVGDPTAENEMVKLADYYVETDEYQRAQRGEVNLVVGRKGSGKTALFIQMRDSKRARKANIVVDLAPEGFQLLKLKEQVLVYLTDGAQQHLITALWEYVLLLEISYKVLEKDKEVHLRDHTLTEHYQVLRDVYGDTELSMEGDFRERLSKLSNLIVHEFTKHVDVGLRPPNEKSLINIQYNQITEFLYQHDIKKLYAALVKYLSLKGEVWFLFDNIDKGWNVEGISTEDIFILRCLINACRKIERNFKSAEITFHSIVFVRDDAYSLLMQGSADYGKEMRASLDWSDATQLGDVLVRRILQSVDSGDPNLLSKVCVSHYQAVPWLEFMTSQSLMRPRNLLKLFKHSLSYAINLRHGRIEEEDITKGLKTYAQDLIIEVDRELADIYPKARKLIYEFAEETTEYTEEELLTLLQCTGLDAGQATKVVDFLLYFGVIGVQRASNDPIFIYDVNYDIEMLRVKVKKWAHTTRYIVNPALWPALNIRPSAQQQH